MPFEVFSRKGVRRVGTPTVSFMRSGRVALNRAAAKIFEEQAVEYVVLLWDSAASKVGIRPITKKDPRAYRLNRSGKGGGAGFSAVTFFEHIGFDHKKETRAFPAQWNAELGIFEFSIADEATAGRQTPLLAMGAAGRQSR